MSDRQIPSYERMGIILESTLSGTEKFTLITLNQFVDGHGECWPGNQRLARLMSTEVTTVKRRIAALEAKGIVTRRRRFNPDGSETSSVKQIDFEAIRSMASQNNPLAQGGGVPVHQGGCASAPGGGAVALRGGCSSATGGGAPVHHDLSNRTDPEEQIQKKGSSPPPAIEVEAGGGGLVPVSSPRPTVPESKPVRGGKSSAAAIDYGAWQAAYNELKPDCWAQCKVMNPARQKQIAAALKGHPNPGEALEDFRRALAHIKTCRDSYWRDWENGCIETLFHKGRWVGWAEAGAQAQVQPQAVAASGLSDQQIQSARQEVEERQNPAIAAYDRMLEERDRRRLENEKLRAAAAATPWGAPSLYAL